MLEVLKFIFSSFWIWVGTVILISAIIPNFHFGTKHYHCDKKDDNKDSSVNEPLAKIHL